MKKWLTALCALLFLPALALAQDMVSITELQAQADEMERWAQVYEAYGRTIEADIPVIVPEADCFPIIQVSAQMGFEVTERLNLQEASDQTNAGVGIFYDDPNILSYLDESNTSGEAATVYRTKPEEMDFAFFQTFSHEPLMQRSGNWGFAVDYYYPYEADPETLFAEDNELSLADAEHALERLLAYYYGETAADVEMDYVEVRGRARRQAGRRLDGLGDYKADYPKGTYCLHYRQKLEGIPVYLEIGSKRLTTGEGNITRDVALKWGRISDMSAVNYVEFMDNTSFFLNAVLLREERILEADVPLASLDEVIDRLEQEISDGHLRNVYALRLGYVCYLDETSPDTYTLYPAWICDCIYTDSARKEIETPIFSDAFRDNFCYEQIVIDAQTCELQTGWIAENDGLYHKDPITWDGL